MPQSQSHHSQSHAGERRGRGLERPVTPTRPPTTSAKSAGAPPPIIPAGGHHAAAHRRDHRRDNAPRDDGRDHRRDDGRDRRSHRGTEKERKEKKERRRRTRRKEGESHAGQAKRAKTAPVVKASAKKDDNDNEKAKAASSGDESSSSSSSDESPKVEVKEELPAETAAPASSSGTQIMVSAISSRMDEMTAVAMSFSRSLVRAQQALRTSARIARDAAMGFESEMENFSRAEKEINETFGLKFDRDDEK